MYITVLSDYNEHFRIFIRFLIIFMGTTQEYLTRYKSYLSCFFQILIKISCISNIHELMKYNMMTTAYKMSLKSRILVVYL